MIPKQERVEIEYTSDDGKMVGLEVLLRGLCTVGLSATYAYNVDGEW